MLIHYGWDVSPYSAKTRSYLRFKGIPHRDRHPDLFALMGTVRRGVGRPVMPTVQRDDGVWMQDTSEIIDALEEEHPEPSIVPPGPTQRLASSLLELHADEWLPIVIMHTRWNIPENARFARTEFAREGLPWLPLTVGRFVTGRIADTMASYRPKLGISEATVPGIESFARTLLARLDGHFAIHRYLLGGRPCLGDFALFGPLWAHLYRDPGTRHWFDDAEHLVDWFDRMQTPEPPGDWLDGDVVPETLDAVFGTLFDEHWSHLADLVRSIDAWVEDNPGATRLPRSLGDHEFVIGGYVGRRRLITYSQWMLQRPLDIHAALEGEADAWLERVGGSEAVKLQVRNRTVRRGFREVLER